MQQKVCLEFGSGSTLQESFLLDRRRGSNFNQMKQADKQNKTKQKKGMKEKEIIGKETQRIADNYDCKFSNAL